MLGYLEILVECEKCGENYPRSQFAECPHKFKDQLSRWLMRQETPTKVVNIKTYKGDYVYIGRGSSFGNPFPIGKSGSREEVIDKYREWFHKKLGDPEFKKKVLALKGMTLGCFCKPKACHGDVIKEWLDECNCAE